MSLKASMLSSDAIVSSCDAETVVSPCSLADDVTGEARSASCSLNASDDVCRNKLLA